MNALELAKSIIDELIDKHQVICDSAHITRTTSDIPCFRDGTTIRAKLITKGSGIAIENAGKTTPIAQGSYIRLAPSRTRAHVISPRQKPHYHDRIQFYRTTLGPLRGLVRALRIGLHLRTSRKLHLGISPLSRLEQHEGITFHVKELTGDTAHLTCVDHGGFYDYFINGETYVLPPQVPGNYYASDYFCVTSRLLHTLTKNPLYLEAAQLAFTQATRDYPSYRYAKIAFDHHEFKAPLLLEYAKLAGTPLSLPLHESEYQPVNMNAVHCHTASIGNDSARLTASLDNLQKNQTKDGLIQDNFFPYCQNAIDLTYHHFTAACLCRAHEHSKDARLLPLIQKAMQFSHSIMLTNGETTYYGRGSNNIYHLASAAYAHAYAYHLWRRPEYLAAAHATLAYLFRQGTGILPTAMNDSANRMIGWNHCEIPYNAQTAYFLIHTHQLINGPEPTTFTPLTLTTKKTEHYYRHITPHYCATITTGAEHYSWANGQHVTGVAGLAALIHNGNSQTLCLDKTPLHTITDLPLVNTAQQQLIHGIWTMHTRKNTCTLTKKRAGITMTRTYTFFPRHIDLITTIHNPLCRNISISQLNGLCSTKTSTSRLTIITASPHIHTKTQKDHVPSNPRGTGTRYRVGTYAGRERHTTLHARITLT